MFVSWLGCVFFWIPGQLTGHSLSPSNCIHLCVFTTEHKDRLRHLLYVSLFISTCVLQLKSAWVTGSVAAGPLCFPAALDSSGFLRHSQVTAVPKQTQPEVQKVSFCSSECQDVCERVKLPVGQDYSRVYRL